MSQEEINRSVRRSRRARVLGPDACCSRCGCMEVTALAVRTRQKQRVILCYECDLATRRKTTTERHHVVGEKNESQLTITVPGNTHRILSDLQQDWPAEVRHNPERDPLLRLAAHCHSLKDHLQIWVDRLAALAEWFADLAHALREHLGIRWWEILGIGNLFGRLGWEVGQ